MDVIGGSNKLQKSLRLFMTKTSEFWECPMKGHLRNHENLIPQGTNPNFARGSYVHLVMEKAWEFLLKENRRDPEALDMAFGHALVQAEPLQRNLDEETKELCRHMAFSLWPIVQSQNITEVEKSKAPDYKPVDLDVGWHHQTKKTGLAAGYLEVH